LLFVNGQHRGPVRRFRSRVAGLKVAPRRGGEHTGRQAGPEARPNGRNANVVAFTPMCSVSPDCTVTTAHGCTSETEPTGAGRKAGGRYGPRKCERRPWPGRRCENHVKPGYQACTFSCQPGQAATAPAWLDTPPAAGRAWVPGCRARTSERP